MTGVYEGRRGTINKSGDKVRNDRRGEGGMAESRSYSQGITRLQPVFHPSVHIIVVDAFSAPF